jgi:hypothetical protein
MGQFREVIHMDVLATASDPHDPDQFLEECLVGSTWLARIRTAEVRATVLSREPLGSFDERSCTCLRLRLDRPVPIEPRHRFQIVNPATGMTAACLVRPWAE